MGRDPPITITIVFLVEKSKNEMTRNDTKRSLKQRGEEGRGRGRGRVREKRKKTRVSTVTKYKKKKKEKRKRGNTAARSIERVRLLKRRKRK